MEVVNKMYKLSELPNVYCLSVNVKDDWWKIKL